MKRFLDNIELWLSGAGLLVVWVASAVVAPGGADLWKVAAVTALLVSVLHGFIFWVVRRRQRIVRRRAINDIQEMAADVIKNQLAVINMWAKYDAQNQSKEDLEFQLNSIGESVDNIARMVDDLSEEALSGWKMKYQEAIANATDLEPAF